MSSRRPEPTAPSIVIALGDAGPRVQQLRPAVVATLAGMAVAKALQLIPTLLPICGQAQSQAARRAVAAAIGEPESPAERDARELQLWREQAFAAAWRMCIDWPDLLGEQRQLAELGAVHRAADDASRAAALAELVPGLDPVTDLEQLLDWVRQGDCPAARTAGLALAVSLPPAAVQWVRDDALVQRATAAFGRTDFDALNPGQGALEVGPLAMCRDPLVTELQLQLGASVPARLLAQLLDARVICRALTGDGDRTGTVHSWRVDQGAGLGRAVTARGPVFHQVRVQPAEQDLVLDWRVLAPTDWHFSPGGAVISGLAGVDDRQAARLLVASFDPCAPWTLRSAGQEV